jgi:hypothetical protein
MVMEFYSDEESDRFIPDGPFKDGWIHESGPQEWSSPGTSLDNEAFWKTYRDCSNKLPKNVRARCKIAGGGWCREQGNLCHAERYREQSLGDAASRANGVAAVSRNELVRKAESVGMKIIDSLKRRSLLWVWNHTPNCAEVSRLTSGSFEQPLPVGTWLTMRLHYLICVWCRRYLKHLNLLHAVAHRLDEHANMPVARLSAEAKQRIVQRLQSAQVEAQ